MRGDSETVENWKTADYGGSKITGSLMKLSSSPFNFLLQEVGTVGIAFLIIESVITFTLSSVVWINNQNEPIVIMTILLLVIIWHFYPLLAIDEYTSIIQENIRPFSYSFHYVSLIVISSILIPTTSLITPPENLDLTEIVIFSSLSMSVTLLLASKVVLYMKFLKHEISTLD